MRKTPSESAYTSDVAHSYDSDREVEDIWQIEQKYIEKEVNDFTKDAKLLDIPIGTGRFIPVYERRGIQVLGVDISSDMLAEAFKKKTSDSISLELGDARNIRAGNQSFDYVVCWRLLHLLPDDILPVVIHEMSRVTAGRIYFQAYVKDKYYYLYKAKNMLLKVLRVFSGNYQKKTPWAHIQSYAHSESRLLAVFKQASLVLKSIDNLGCYGSLSVKVYILEKH